MRGPFILIGLPSGLAYNRGMPASPQSDVQLLSAQDFAAARQADSLLFEVDSSPEGYEEAHIPGAVFFDTNWVEEPGTWNLRPQAQLAPILAEVGLGRDSRALLYSRRSIAAARLALLLLVVGVRRIGILDGGLGAWSQAGLPTESSPNSPAAHKAALAIAFARPDYLTDMAGLKGQVAEDGALLVDVRSRAEHIGESSGYDFMRPRGRIPGSLWAGAGEDKDSMQAYQGPEGRAKALDEIARMWAERGIRPNGPLIFYCGTGWRAAEAFLYAYLMGWSDISVYDGGWYEWSADPDNPIERG